MSFEEKLINQVQENDCLYNVKSKAYKNNIKKEFIWLKISTNELGNSVENCKGRWKSLRDRFVKQRRRRDLPSGSGTHETPKWKYFDNLLFLSDSIRPRKQEGNISMDLNFVNDEDMFISEELVCSTPEVPSFQMDNPFDSSCSTSTSSKKNKKSDAATKYEKFIGTLEETVQKRLCTSACSSENMSFFKTIAIKVDSLPKNIQNELQINILRMVNEATENNTK